MTNPLIDKYFELYPEKKEKPKLKLPKPDYYKGEKSYAEELEELRDTSTISCVPAQSVATSNTGITAANPHPKLTSYDNDSGKDSFLQIAEKIKNGEAKVVNMSVNMTRDIMSGTSVTFEVQV